MWKNPNWRKFWHYCHSWENLEVSGSRHSLCTSGQSRTSLVCQLGISHSYLKHNYERVRLIITLSYEEITMYGSQKVPKHLFIRCSTEISMFLIWTHPTYHVIFILNSRSTRMFSLYELWESHKIRCIYVC